MRNIWFNRTACIIDFMRAWLGRLTRSRLVCDKNISHSFECCENIFSQSLLISFFNSDKKIFSTLFSEGKHQQIVDKGKNILDHNFRIFPNVKITAEFNIRWHKDYLSGKNYPFRYYRRIKVVNLASPDDPKVPWELSRFHHALHLAQAYVLTGQEKYAEKCLALFSDWCKANPWKFGVNWTCAMEVALRACNLLAAFELISKSEAFKKLSPNGLKRVFQQHLDFILQNLEWSEQGTTNHYISDLLGLLVISARLPGLKGARKAEEFALVEIENEAAKQFYQDGGNWESSTAYQRFVTEMLLLIVQTAQRKGWRLSEEFHQKVKDSVNLLTSLANDAGRIPQIGDNDSGRVLPLYRRSDTDIRHLGPLAAILYNDLTLISRDWGFPPEAYWLFGQEGYERYNKLKAESRSYTPSSAAFPDAGLYVMRAGKAMMVISAVPNGQNDHGGHCHNDKLSFTFSVGGREIITDPGTFNYSGDVVQRREFRSTKSHNTVMVDGQEQNRFIERGIFWVQPDAKVKVHNWNSGPDLNVFVGEHWGYTRLEGEIIHKRSISLDKKSMAWLILDEVFERKPVGLPREVAIAFHLAAEEAQEYTGQETAEIFRGLCRRLSLHETISIKDCRGFKVPTSNGDLHVLVSCKTDLQGGLSSCWISDSYLSKYRGQVARYYTKTSLPLRMVTCLWIN